MLNIKFIDFKILITCKYVANINSKNTISNCNIK